ncbi:MAG TPA: GNAT family N-acetyltransferase [Caulobacteraceae bacterium]|jgi:ribosomal protein S18 acetylase RimI-like enzyme
MSAARETVLDNAAWHSLSGAHAALAIGGALAKRFPHDVAPFAATGGAPGGFEALAGLIGAGESVAWCAKAPVPAIDGLRATPFGRVRQMVYRGRPPDPHPEDIVELGPSDVAEMKALADLTKPGPFEARTIALGRYCGIRRDGRLIAMAGERLRPPGFSEISAVCTHPDHRGAGHARRLIEVLEVMILDRGETPFLHVLDDNVGAERLYRDMGYETRDMIDLIVLERPHDD